MNRHRPLLLVLGIFTCLYIVPVVAEAQNNDYYAHYNRYRFHELQMFPRSAAMGGAYSALQGGEEALLGNPAAFGFLEKPYVMIGFDFQEVASDVTLLDPMFPVEAENELWDVGIGGAYPFDWGAVGLLYSYREDDMGTKGDVDMGTKGDVFAFPGFMNQEADMERHHVSVGAGYRINEQWAVGYRYSYIDWELDTQFNVTRPAPFVFATVGEEFQGHRNQVGVQYKLNRNLAFGLDGYYGLGDRDSDLMGNADADSWSIRGGVAWRFLEDIPLLAAMDLNYENRDLDGGLNDSEEDFFSLHLGLEYEAYENLFIRAGYRFEDIEFDSPSTNIFEERSISGYSAGLGYKYGQFKIDYAFVFTDTASSDMGHYVGLGIEF